MDDIDERYKGLPRDLFQDIKRAAYEAKVAEMEDRARRETCKPDAPASNQEEKP